MDRRKVLGIFCAVAVLVAVAVVLSTSDDASVKGADGDYGPGSVKSVEGSGVAETGMETGRKSGKPGLDPHMESAYSASPGSLSNGRLAKSPGGFKTQGEVGNSTRESEAEGDSSENGSNKRPSCTVYGTVSLDGEPRAGVSVFLTRWGFSTGVQTTTTDLGGLYRFEKADWPVSGVSAKVPFGVGTGRLAKCDEDGKIIRIDLDYQKAPVHVFGRVTDREDNPLADSVVAAVDDSHEKNLMDELSYPTDSGGRFEFWLPEGAEKYIVYAQAAGHLSDTKRIPPRRSDVEMLFRLARESNIHGQVVGPEGPKPGVDIFGCDRTRSGRNGRFVLVCGPGPVGIGAWDKKMWGYVKVPARDEAADAYDVVVELKPGRKITGLVKLKNQDPVAMAEILFSCESTGIFDVIRADIQGRFEIDGLPPDDTVWIQSAFDKRPGSKRGQPVDPRQSYVEILLVPDED